MCLQIRGSLPVFVKTLQETNYLGNKYAGEHSLIDDWIS